MSRWFNFTDKTVFVMGGTSGINLGIAEVFARQGAKVAVASRSEEKVSTAIEGLKAFGGEVTGFAADARDPEAVAEGLKKVVDQLGTIDVLVVGQAGNFPAAALDMSPNGFKTVVDIDLLGSFNAIRLAHEYLTKPGASVITISAPQAFIAMPLQAHVCAAKAGVEMLTRVLAIEWGSDGIRVNSIVPGPIDATEGMERLADSEAMKQAVTEKVPLGRFGTTHDIGNCAMFLASPLADYISGTIIPVDGAWSANGAGGMMGSKA